MTTDQINKINKQIESNDELNLIQADTLTMDVNELFTDVAPPPNHIIFQPANVLLNLPRPTGDIFAIF